MRKDLNSLELDSDASLFRDPPKIGVGSRLTQFARWRAARTFSNSTQSSKDLKRALLSLGSWLKQVDYIGSDVMSGYPPKEFSTTLGFSLMGWINLYRMDGLHEYLIEAKACLQRILATQQEDGAWLFPYPFRDNSPDFPYSCEILMTLRSLLYYLEMVEQDEDVIEAIERGITFLSKVVGFDDGILWYSQADRIIVPNVSSMAANVFARSYLIFENKKYLQQAKACSNFCIASQQADGSYPYLHQGESIYIPYHALETWELNEANEIIRDDHIGASTNRAIKFLTSYFQLFSYRSTNLDIKKRRTFYLLKTPLWAAKAYTSKEDFIKAIHHYQRSTYLFKVPGLDCYFYKIRRIGLNKMALLLPMLESIYIRYNASMFEIGSNLLRFCD